MMRWPPVVRSRWERVGAEPFSGYGDCKEGEKRNDRPEHWSNTLPVCFNWLGDRVILLYPCARSR